jgi:hypothetical protein
MIMWWYGSGRYGYLVKLSPPLIREGTGERLEEVHSPWTISKRASTQGRKIKLYLKGRWGRTWCDERRKEQSKDGLRRENKAPD